MPLVTVILPLRDMEDEAATAVRSAAEVQAHVIPPKDLASDIAFEVLALDERSGDNTLSVLSVLHGQIECLRTLQDIPPGAAIRRASSVARGDTWLVVDRPIDPGLGGWGVSQVLRGQRAAIVPGELLVVDRTLGVDVLRSLTGGLVMAQRKVSRHLRGLGLPFAFSPPPNPSPQHKAGLFLRRRLAQVGLARFDRPWSKRPASS